MATKTHRKGRRASPRKSNAAGRELLEAVRELHHAVVTGDHSKLTIRQVEVPDPGEYSPRDVKTLREALRISQGLFARIIGVSPELVAHWEYGVRTPSPLARRLLDRIKADPAAYVTALVHRRPVRTLGRLGSHGAVRRKAI